MNTNQSRLIIYLLGIIILVGSVSAATIDFNNILHPFQALNIAAFYLSYYAFIDALVYLVLFLSIGQMTFLKVFKDSKKEAKMVAVAVALSLTVGMIVLESDTGFSLGKLYPIALLIFLIVLAILLYNLFLGLFTEKNGKSVSGALTYLVIYGLLIVPFNVLYQWIDQNASLLSSILALGAVASFIYLLIQLIGMFKSDDAPTPAREGNNNQNGNNRQGNREDNNLHPEGETRPPTAEDQAGNTLAITSPVAHTVRHYAQEESIPLIFTATGPAFNNGLDYAIRLNQNVLNRINNAHAGEVHGQPIVGMAPGAYTLEIIALQPGTNNIILEQTVIFHVDGAPSMANSINGLNNLLQQLRTTAAVNADHDIIVCNHHSAFMHRQSDDDATADEWAQLYHAEAELIQAVNAFNQGMHTFVNDPGYATLHGEELRLYQAIIEQYARFNTSILQFYNYFVDSYNRGNPINNNPFRVQR